MEIRTLTGLRGYAALWVLLFHYTSDQQGDGVLLAILRQGICGLTVFFVLSGFILAHVYTERFSQGVDGASYLDFLRARFARVYPVHFITLLAWLVLIPRQPADTALAFVLNLGLVQSWGFVNDLNWNQPSWSVSVELFAYLLFPFLFTLALRGGWPVRISLFVAACWAVWTLPYSRLVVPFVQEMGWSTTGLIFLYGLSLFQWLFIFCLGVFVQPFAQFALSRVSQNWLWDAIFLAGVGLFGLLCVDPSQLWAAAPAAVLITVGLHSDKGLGSALCGNPAALFLGRISYSLYLTHIMLMWIWPLYLGVTAPPLLTASYRSHSLWQWHCTSPLKSQPAIGLEAPRRRGKTALSASLARDDGGASPEPASGSRA
jgi:peptidoglycan/LPS O-acetylase OafA/YrhL